MTTESLTNIFVRREFQQYIGKHAIAETAFDLMRYAPYGLTIFVSGRSFIAPPPAGNHVVSENSTEYSDLLRASSELNEYFQSDMYASLRAAMSYGGGHIYGPPAHQNYRAQIRFDDFILHELNKDEDIAASGIFNIITTQSPEDVLMSPKENDVVDALTLSSATEFWRSQPDINCQKAFLSTQAKVEEIAELTGQSIEDPATPVFAVFMYELPAEMDKAKKQELRANDNANSIIVGEREYIISFWAIDYEATFNLDGSPARWSDGGHCFPLPIHKPTATKLLKIIKEDGMMSPEFDAAKLKVCHSTGEYQKHFLSPPSELDA